MPRVATILLSSRFQRACYASAMTLFLAIVLLGSIPGARHNMGQLASGLVLHSTAYAILGALLFLGSRGGASRRAVCTVITIAVMGATDECVQSFWPYRAAALSDWLIDVISGTVVASVLWRCWRSWVDGIIGPQFYLSSALNVRPHHRHSHSPCRNRSPCRSGHHTCGTGSRNRSPCRSHNAGWRGCSR